MAIFVLLILFLFHLCLSDNIGHRVILTDAANNYGAKCIDGTPGNYYFANGTESQKYVIYFQGGGWYVIYNMIYITMYTILIL